MVVVKPLYGIAKAGTYWWVTYNKHHKEKLLMVNLTYDSCLLVTKTGSLFGVVSMQTDDTVILGDDIFNIRESDEMIFKCKEKIELE